jgi:hypothetical protein
MPQLDGTGPERKGNKTGRGLGKCQETDSEDKLRKLGKGMGKRRKKGGGQGKAKRLMEGKQKI